MSKDEKNVKIHHLAILPGISYQKRPSRSIITNYDTNKRYFLPSYRLVPLAKILRGAESQALFFFRSQTVGKTYMKQPQKMNKTGLEKIWVRFEGNDIYDSRKNRDDGKDNTLNGSTVECRQTQKFTIAYRLGQQNNHATLPPNKKHPR